MRPSTRFRGDPDDLDDYDSGGRPLTLRSSPRKLGILALVVLIVGGLVGWGIVHLNSYSRTDGGTVMVIRNGGWLDNTAIREVLPINSPRTFTGYFSTEHPYVAGGRYYDTTGTPGGGDGAGTVNVWLKTADGVNVGAIGQFQFTLDTDQAKTYDPVTPFVLQPDGITYQPSPKARAEGGLSLVEIFDNRFGTRQFPVADNPDTEDEESGQAYPWEPNGWVAFLDGQARTQMQGAFNQVIGGTRCVDINPACALVVQSTQAEKDAAAAAAASGQPVAAPDNTKLLRDFETKVAAALTANMTKNMSAPFFSGITYSASSIRLDPAVDQQIAAAQAKFAETTAAIAQGQKDQADAAARKAVAQTDADARKAVATTDADANAEKQRGYASCPACAEQDMQRLRNEGIKNLPPNVTTLVGQGADVLLQR